MKRALIILLLFTVGIVSVAYGCYSTFFERNGYVETNAVITRVDEYEVGLTDNNMPEYQYDVYVKYRVDGEEYEGKLDYFEDGYEKGKEIVIFYDPEVPEKIHGNSTKFGIYLMIVGFVLMIASAITFLRKR